MLQTHSTSYIYFNAFSVLGGQNSITLPQYTPGAISLLEYTQAVVRNLQKMIHILVEGHIKRREYIAAVLCQFEGYSYKCCY